MRLGEFNLATTDDATDILREWAGTSADIGAVIEARPFRSVDDLAEHVGRVADDAAADRVRGTVDEYPDFTVEGSLAQ